MPNLPSTVLRAGVVALALVAHLWMLDAHGPAAPGTPGPTQDLTAATVAAPEHPGSLSGCPTGMSACRATVPAHPLAALLGLAAAVAVLSDVAAGPDGSAAARSALTASERAPPWSLAVPSSVVLRV